MKIKRKAYAFITRGSELLVFTQPASPQAGVQVPGGTIEDGEEPEMAVLREAKEETGLTELKIRRYLGYRERDMSDGGTAEHHHRYFYHLECRQTCPQRWRHGESTPSEGTESFIPFDLFWIPLSSRNIGLTDDFEEMRCLLLMEVSDGSGKATP